MKNNNQSRFNGFLDFGNRFTEAVKPLEIKPSYLQHSMLPSREMTLSVEVEINTNYMLSFFSSQDKRNVKGET